MALREVTTSENTSIETRKKLVRILFTEGAQIYAVWIVEKNGKHRERTVQVSEELRATIMGRAAVQVMIDNVRDDTKDKVNA